MYINIKEIDKMGDFFLDLRDDILDFIDNHRKGLIIGSAWGDCFTNVS